ncbi:hypothetical protein PZ897_01960 [Hoeflea sp. YIM 152468]|uniref:hypothetical protein n=1 Tax=Hoeflea sp. YIM 152468 TaxID=3031759 RepID=UPI0023D9F6A1|nr:hypothetical protein [Hoeflea sp. YIM 152468]MDF1606935.1 hypothetical protein [Hoeflea sp. YIM 152468]
MTTDLYRRTIEWSEKKLDAEGHELTLKCWQSRPWMVDAFTDGINSDREREMNEWCRDNFGPEAWPIHGKPGDWYRGSATVYGWTHIGFATVDMMNQFLARWPAPETV